MRTLVCIALSFMWHGASPPRAMSLDDVDQHPATATWIMEPLALDDDVSARDLEVVGDAVRTAWSALRPTTATVNGLDGIIARMGEPNPALASVDASLRLLQHGEKRYMAFDFSTAAAALAEAAGRLTEQIGRLSGSALEELSRARVLEAVAWLELGNRAAAVDAFAKLVSVRPDYDPDPVLLPPAARRVFDEARLLVRKEGVGALQISTEPPAAKIWLDSQYRGRAPLTVTGVPVGQHQVRAVAPGRTPLFVSVDVPPTGTSKKLILQKSAIVLTVNRLGVELRNGAATESITPDLRSIANAAQLSDIVIVGLALRGSGATMMSGVRWRGRIRAGVVITELSPDARHDAELAVHSLVNDAWPPVFLPPDLPRLDVDFERAALGVGPTWGRKQIVSDDGVASQWWFWTAAAVAVLGGSTAIYMGLRPPEQRQNQDYDYVQFEVEN